jgi:hypothetical protein
MFTPTRRQKDAGDYRSALLRPRRHRGGVGGHSPGPRARRHRGVDAHALDVKGCTDFQRVLFRSPDPFLGALLGAVSKLQAFSCRRCRGNSSSVSSPTGSNVHCVVGPLAGGHVQHYRAKPHDIRGRVAGGRRVAFIPADQDGRYPLLPSLDALSFAYKTVFSYVSCADAGTERGCDQQRLPPRLGLRPTRTS